MQDESVLVFPVWPQTGYAVGTAVGANKDCMDSIPLQQGRAWVTGSFLAVTGHGFYRRRFSRLPIRWEINGKNWFYPFA